MHAQKKKNDKREAQERLWWQKFGTGEKNWVR
jgi:hypothetical protein